MGFFDTLKKPHGGYIFLSHSHRDIDRVRDIRNRLEDNGFDPLCFYLKCLDDDSEIEDLIKREIDAREWFFFLDSENSRKSKWVTLEREYIAQTANKKIISIDINDERSVDEAIDRISHNLRVFLSYSAKDYQLAHRLKCKLEEKDYLVFFAPECIPVGIPYGEVISDAIKEASQDGCVIVLLTPASVNNAYILNEVSLAISNNGNIISVVAGDIDMDTPFRYLLSRTQFHTLSDDPTDEQLDSLVDRIGHAIVAKRH